MSQKFHPTFKIGSKAQQDNELSIGSFPKEGLNPRFCPSLKNGMDNSSGHQIWGKCWELTYMQKIIKCQVQFKVGLGYVEEVY